MDKLSAPINKPKKTDANNEKINSAVIKAALIEFTAKNPGRKPTKTAIAKMTGFHRDTVAKHLSTVDVNDIVSEHLAKLLFGGPIWALHKRAEKTGDPTCIRLLAELFGVDVGGKTKIDLRATMNANVCIDYSKLTDSDIETLLAIQAKASMDESAK